MNASELMTPDPFTVTPDDSMARAAEVMRNIGVGAVPVVSSQKDLFLRGIITDRDIAIRCVAANHGTGSCRVADHMTPVPLHTVLPSAHQAEVLSAMETAQVRRLPVIDSAGKLVGIIAQADVARKLGTASPRTVDEMLEIVSAPACQITTRAP